MAKSLAINKLLKSLRLINTGDEVLKISILKDLYCSDDIIIKNSSCGDYILKLAKDLSKIATTYYGKGGAGLLLVCREDNTVLMLKRSRHVEQPMTWGIPGGALSRDEGWHKKENINQVDFSDQDFYDAAFREANEELFSSGGTSLDQSKMTLIGETEFKDGGFTYKTFIYDIPLEEKRRITGSLSLNWENDKAKWYSLSDLPQNLHFGVKFTKDNLEEQGVQLFQARSDELDWIRDYLRSLTIKVNSQSEQVLKNLIDKVSIMIPTLSTKSEKEDYSEFRFKVSNAVHDFFNYAIKEISRVGEKKVAIEMMNYASKFARKPKDKYDSSIEGTSLKTLTKLPSGEQSAHTGFFYHGSELRNAISILRSGIFVGAGAFTRLSLTSDLSVAAKFGDTIFVFDAKKLQRSGAKKMNYGDIGTTEGVRRNTGKPVDENYLKNPWINELYRYEKEWVLPLPYQLRPGDLVKIIYFSNTSNRDASGYSNDKYTSANEAFAALDAVTDVPIEIMNYPSFGSHSPSVSKKVTPETANLTELIYTSALSEQASAENLMKKYSEERAKRFPATSTAEGYKNDPVYTTLWRLYRLIEDMGSYARQLEFKSNYDAGKAFDFYSEIERMLERIEYLPENYKFEILGSYGLSYRDVDVAVSFYMPYISSMKSICEKILSRKDEFKDIILKKNFGELSKPIEENYIVRYFIYPSGEPEAIRKGARELCTKNIDKILSIPNMMEYLNTNGPKVYGESDYKWYSKEINDQSIKWRTEDLIRYADPSLVPDDKYVEHFLGLIDSEKIESIPDDRLERISKKYLSEGKEKYSGHGKFDDKWIYDHRSYKSEAEKKKLEVIMKSLNKDSKGFSEEETNS